MEILDHGITKDFLEQALGKEISNFVIKPGSNSGDGYSSTLWAIDVTFRSTDKESKTELNNCGSGSGCEANPSSENSANGKLNLENQPRLHLLLKCYPRDIGRQGFLTHSNVFMKELRVYRDFFPKLLEFQSTGLTNKIFYRPPFPDFFHGVAVNYDVFPKDVLPVCENPLENFLLMTDLRETGGYRNADRHKGFDLDHCTLVMNAYATVHALSWAYKMVTNTPSLAEKFDFLGTSLFDNLDEDMNKVVRDHNARLFLDAISCLPNLPEARKSALIDCIEKFKDINKAVTMLYFSAKPNADPSVNKDNCIKVSGEILVDEEPWMVFTHGDAWGNNLMFKYDEDTGKPIDVQFVDFQLAKEGDPFTDICYNIFVSTTSEFRKENMNHLLELYTKKFQEICANFKVPPPPGFKLSEVLRRYHRAKAFGLSMALMVLPIVLNQENNVADLGSAEEVDIVVRLERMAVAMRKNKVFAQRAVDLVEELYDQNII